MSATPLQGDVAVVTGASGGMGRVIAFRLAARGLHVVTVARDPHRAADLRVKIARETTGTLEVIQGDLSSRQGLRTAAEAITSAHPVVHLLVNNAGAHYLEHRRSPDGLEMHVAVDYLAAYGLTRHLDQQLRRGRARIVNVASDTLRDTRQIKLIGRPRPATIEPGQLHDLTLLNPVTGFVPFEAYARAKLLTVTAGFALARTFARDGVTLNAVHPGIVSTPIIDDLVPRALQPFKALIRRALLTPEQGAEAALHLAADPELGGVSGRYYVRDTETPAPAVSYDPDVQRRLLESTDQFLALG